MCLAIPSKITQIKNNMATIDVDGVQREASLLLLEDAGVGDFVIVHAGFAIQKIDEAAAIETLKFLKEAVALVVNGFCKEVLQALPMEFAMEAQQLVAISLEGSVG